MKHILTGTLLTMAIYGIAGAQSTPPAVAQHQQAEIARGEPARWQKEDGNLQAQAATKRKEIGAALNEALHDCKQQPANARSECVKQARATYQQDMANVKELVAQSNALGGVYATSGPSE